jgi:hypothetical protein
VRGAVEEPWLVVTQQPRYTNLLLDDLEVGLIGVDRHGEPARTAFVQRSDDVLVLVGECVPEYDRVLFIGCCPSLILRMMASLVLLTIGV